MSCHRLLLAAALAPWLSSACVVGDEIEDPELEESEARTTATIRIVQHNIEKKMDVMLRALDEAAAIKADGVTLQEVCPDQVQWLIDSYSDVWTIVSVQSPKVPASGCEQPDGTRGRVHTVSIWRRGANGDGARFSQLSGVEGAPGDMACVKFRRGGVPVVLCAVHLNVGVDGYDGEALRLRSTTRIKNIVRDRWLSRGKFVIIGGDFNSQPNSPPLDKMYAPALGGTGDFTEYNRTGAGRNGRATAHSSSGSDRKIDYVFHSTNRAPRDGDRDQIIRTASDHDMVTSTVKMRK